MYRYVFKRVKETFEFGINARKSYACQQANSIKYKNQEKDQQQQSRQIIKFQEINFLTPAEFQQKRYEDFKRKYNCRHPDNCNPFLQALTWTTAVAVGFYAAQILNLCRRNQRLDPKKCFYTRYLACKNRLIQKKLLCSHYAKHKNQDHQSIVASSSSQIKCPLQKLLINKRSLQTPVEKKEKATEQEEENDFVWSGNFSINGLFDKRFDTFYDNFGDTYTYKRVVFNVNNDSNQTLLKSKDDNRDHSENSSKSSTELNEETIDMILLNLTEMISEVEFQLGVDSIMHGHFDEGVEHFRMAANSNHAGSLFNLALLYEQGLGVKKDTSIAYKLYKSAGELGHDKALFNQAIFHARGLGGVKKSLRTAKKLFQKSAALGNSDAIEALSMLLPDYHQKNLFVEPDDYIASDVSNNSSLSLESTEYFKNIHSIAIT
ncbi:hypothetical protein PVAND_010577 [Polypedilum vanderplanki]|uniref:Death ligand signal enhancer n=1 Tax=Polypedilum vanderplanki TaxID=319348 RepID=A0A9J6CGP4_POLVA|nr:hypothetical protein PVAND_010577 [Polypedilum vanderplanki]